MWLVVEKFLSHAEVINFRWSDCGKRSGTIFLQSMSVLTTQDCQSYNLIRHAFIMGISFRVHIFAHHHVR